MRNHEVEENRGVGGGADWSILQKYAEDERRRIDEYRHNLVSGVYEDGNWQTPEEVRQVFEQEKSERTPSAFRRLGRAVLKMVNLETARSRTEQNREAMAQALREQDLAEGMEEWRQERANMLRRERVQEILEKEFNEKLTRVEGIREQAEAGNPEVERRVLNYMGGEVEVLDLKGLPFALLNHDVEYQGSGKRNFGVENAVDRLVENPELWIRRRDEVTDANNGELRAITLSTSYINSESNIDTRAGTVVEGEHPELCYGFDHVEPGSLLDLAETDVGMAGYTDVVLADEHRIDFFREVEGSDRNGGYNEVALRRYGERGESRKPDCIIAENGQITEEMLKHAQFFGVPIINIERSYYEEKFAGKVKDVLRGVGEDDDLSEVETAIGKIGSLAGYTTLMKPIVNYGGDREEKWLRARGEKIMNETERLDIEDKRKMLELLAMEAEKRVEFIGDELEIEEKKCQEKTEKGEVYRFLSEVLEDFKVSIEDRKTRRRLSRYEEGNEEDLWMVEVEMTMKESGKKILTRIYRDEEGGVFDEVMPKALRYLQAQWRNEERG